MRRVVRRWLLHLREDGVSWSVFVSQLYIGLLDGIFILWISTFVSLTVGRAEPCSTLRCRAFVILTVVGFCLEFFLSIIFFVA